MSIATDGVTTRYELPVTSVARTLDDLPTRLQRRATREARFQQLIPGAPGPRVRSGLEHRFLDVIEDVGFPRPQVNAIVDGHERDFFWPQFRLVVEVDGPQHDRDDVARALGPLLIL